jgi:hypothetical protein
VIFFLGKEKIFFITKIMATQSCSTIIFQNGNSYQGDLKNGNIRHGYGVMQLKNGHVYRGEFVNNKRHGYGTYEYGDDKYEGNFEKNKRHGYGVYTYFNHATYSGYWRNNLKEGHGCLKYSDGVVVSGIFLNGEVSYGEIKFPNESKYIGSLDNCLMHGVGTLTYSDGFQIKGEFNDDNLILENEQVCCFCLDNDCDDECYETFEGICGNPEVFDENLRETKNVLTNGKRVRTKVIENDAVWSKSYSGIVTKVNGIWSYVKFDDGDYLMIKNELLEVLD